MYGIAADDLRLKVVRPTLVYLNLWCQSSENLLLGTVAVKSNMGRYLASPHSSELSIYGIDPQRHQEIWWKYLSNRKELYEKVLSLVSQQNIYSHKNDDLIFNLAYATAIARIVYLRIPEALPAPDDVEGLANYWKQHYDTADGKGMVEQFIKNYHECVLGFKE